MPWTVLVAWEWAIMTPGSSRAHVSCASGMLWHEGSILSTWVYGAALNCSVLLHAGTFQNCTLRACFALLFLVIERKWFKFSFKMFISWFFSSVRHFCDPEPSPLALFVTTCLLFQCCGYFWGVSFPRALGPFWIVATLATLFFICRFHIHFLLVGFFKSLIKTKSLRVILPVRNLTIYFVFLSLYSYDGAFLYVRFKNTIIHLKIKLITEYIRCQLLGYFR